MKKSLILKNLLIVLVFALLISGCTNNSAPVQASDTTEPTAEEETVIKESFIGNKVVDIEYVKSNISNDNFLAIDARGTDTMKKDGSLEGAIGVVWQQLSTVSDGNPGEANWGVVLDSERLSKALSDIGLTKDKDIVIFADTKNGWGDDGRILWTLSMAGYDNVKILDGGIDAIKESGLPISKEPAPYVPTTVTIDNIDLADSINTDELNALLAEGKVKIIDTRDESEFNGATKYGEAAGGHIPGSINISYLKLLNEDGTLKSNNEIDSMMSEYEISKDDIIVTYCTAGIRSAHMQQILEMNGYSNVKNYDESFYRWSAVNEVEK